MGKETKKITVALMGCGTVGGAVASILTRDKNLLLERNSVEIKLKYIVDVNFTHATELGISDQLFCKDLSRALDDKEVDIFIELVGGTTLAKDSIEKALKAKKAVVTANKALLAQHGVELLALARENGVSIAFEASCAGGIPVIRAITDGLIANRINALYGIVNGTCNYILSSMDHRGISYAQALKEAQQDGLAEANPTLDVAGIDSAHKLTILAALAFGKKVDFNQIPVEGIDKLSLQDVSYGEELGYVVKLLAIAQRQGDGIILCVRPAFISIEHPLAWVVGPFNAVSIYGHATGHTMYYGRGAGGNPTASAIIADIVETGLGITKLKFENLNVWPDMLMPALQLPIDEVISRYYIRMTTMEQPGVLAQIATIFATHKISICSVLQKELMEEDDENDEGVPIIITTHPAKEGNMKAALKEIDTLDVIKAKSICIQIVDEHPEWNNEEL